MGITLHHQTGKDQLLQLTIFLVFTLSPWYLNRDGHHSSTSNRHAERAKTSCSAPTQSRSPSAHRSRSVSAALRQAGSPVKSLTQPFFGYWPPLTFLPPWRMLSSSYQASLLSSDPSGSGLTIGPNAWLKRKVTHFQLFHSKPLSFFLVAPPPSAPRCSFSDRGDLGGSSRTSSISGTGSLMSSPFSSIGLRTPIFAINCILAKLTHYKS